MLLDNGDATRTPAALGKSSALVCTLQCAKINSIFDDLTDLKPENMFSRPRAKVTAPPPRKKRKVISAIEEITFDPSAREDYLSGFHKRKLQRIRHAKEEAAKREREEKLTARKIVRNIPCLRNYPTDCLCVQLREGRKADLEKHVEAVNLMLREQDGNVSDSSEDLEGDQWNGIAENPVVDHEDEYVDEDRFTTVTVEAVDVTRDGLRKAVGEDDNSQESGTEGVDNGSSKGVAGHKRTGLEKGKRIWTKEPPKGPKKRKKKFHYENKAERKITRYKERSGNKEKAKVRKS